LEKSEKIAQTSTIPIDRECREILNMQILDRFFKIFSVFFLRAFGQFRKKSILLGSVLFWLVFFSKFLTPQKVGQNVVEKIATIDILNKNTKCRRMKMDGMFRPGKILD